MAFEDPPLDASGYDYVQDAQPSEAVEGETWYDTGVDEAYVYDGANWLELTVLDHGELSGVAAGDHRSDQNIEDTVHDRPSAGSGLSEDANGNFNYTDHSRPASTQNSGRVHSGDWYVPYEASDSNLIDDQVSTNDDVFFNGGQTETVKTYFAGAYIRWYTHNDSTGDMRVRTIDGAGNIIEESGLITVDSTTGGGWNYHTFTGPGPRFQLYSPNGGQYVTGVEVQPLEVGNHNHSI